MSYVDNISIEFKQFGIALTFTHIVLGNGLNDLKIIPEMGEFDTTRSRYDDDNFCNYWVRRSSVVLL